MACDHRGHEVHFVYPSGTIACTGRKLGPHWAPLTAIARTIDYQLAVLAQDRYEVTCVDCLVAIAEDSEHCWRCNQPDPNQPANKHMRHTCDPADHRDVSSSA